MTLVATFLDYVGYVVRGNAQALFFLVLALMWGGMTFLTSGK